MTRRPLPSLLIVLCIVPVLGACGMRSDNTSVRFNNPWLTAPEQHRMWSFLKTRFFGDMEWADWPSMADRVPTTDVALESVQSPPADRPQATWVGHSTVLIQYQSVSILTDPIFSERASPVSFAGPRRITAPAITIAQLPEIDLVVISHNHYDHLDLASVRALATRVKLWAVPLGVADFIRDAIGQNANVIELDWWQSHDTDRFSIVATPSQHWSGRGLRDRYQSHWASWAVQIDDFQLWFAGDTGYNDVQFAEIGRRLPDINLGLIPIGAYEPRDFMKDMHVNPAEAAQIHTDVGAAQSIGIHWGTFPLTAEPPDEPPRLLLDAMLERNIARSQFRAIAVGETIVLDAGASQVLGGCAARNSGRPERRTRD